jgi:flagellar basal-body rod protein FlgC
VVNLEEVAFEPLLNRDPKMLMEEDPEDQLGGVRVAGISEDQSEGALIYDPGHPDADGNGYVMMPNVDISTEIVDLMGARRMFEANATVFQAVKSILRRSTQL